MKKEERVDRIDECCQADMIVFARFATEDGLCPAHLYCDTMAEKQKMRAPSTTAGLVRYEEEGESLIKLKPKHVVGIVVALIILELFLFLLVPL